MYDKILRRQEVESTVGLKTSQLYALVSKGLFPAPVPLGAKARGWLASEVQVWIEQRAAMRDSKSGLPGTSTCPDPSGYRTRQMKSQSEG